VFFAYFTFNNCSLLHASYWCCFYTPREIIAFYSVRLIGVVSILHVLLNAPYGCCFLYYIFNNCIFLHAPYLCSLYTLRFIIAFFFHFFQCDITHLNNIFPYPFDIIMQGKCVRKIRDTTDVRSKLVRDELFLQSIYAHYFIYSICLGQLIITICFIMNLTEKSSL
jgi:hypothetical protein